MKEIKYIRIKGKERKLLLQITIKSKRISLTLISKFDEVSMSRLNTQKSIACLSIINRKGNFLDIYDHIERLQIPKDKSDIDVQDLYVENYKTLRRPK